MMKRVGRLMPLIVERDNLREAYLRAARGKCERPAVRAFTAALDANLAGIGKTLADGSYEFGPYNFFTVYDPKKRLICAAPFRDRVCFHAIMRVCHGIFDGYQAPVSYASRRGRGTYAALEQATRLSRRYGWFVKLDMVKYFDSIDHNVLRGQLCRLLKDRLLLSHFDRLLETYHTSPGKGLPIGNLTSQYFANHYLAAADHYAKRVLRVPGMVRYMDDLVFFDDDRERLKAAMRDYIDYVNTTLHLDVHQPIMNATSRGLPMLGYVVHRHGGLRLNGRSHRRLVHKLVEWSVALERDEVTIDEYVTHVACLLAFADKARCRQLKRKLALTPGIYPQGLEPREPRWQLEQQREELPRVEPQQQHAVEHEQQPRTAPCPIAPLANGTDCDMKIIVQTQTRGTGYISRPPLELVANGAIDSLPPHSTAVGNDAAGFSKTAFKNHNR